MTFDPSKCTTLGFFRSNLIPMRTYHNLFNAYMTWNTFVLLSTIRESCLATDLKVSMSYTPIAFDERVALWLQRRGTTLCLRVCCIVCLYDCIMIIRKPICTNNATYAHAQGSDRTRWSQNVTLSSKAIKILAKRETLSLHLTRQFLNHESHLLSRSHTFAIIVNIRFETI